MRFIAQCHHLILCIPDKIIDNICKVCRFRKFWSRLIFRRVYSEYSIRIELEVKSIPDHGNHLFQPHIHFFPLLVMWHEKSSSRGVDRVGNFNANINLGFLSRGSDVHIQLGIHKSAKGNIADVRLTPTGFS